MLSLRPNFIGNLTHGTLRLTEQSRWLQRVGNRNSKKEADEVPNT